MIGYPCKDCEKRYVGCHSTCKEYADAKASDPRLSDSYIKEKARELEGYTYQLDGVRRLKKKLNRRR